MQKKKLIMSNNKNNNYNSNNNNLKDGQNHGLEKKQDLIGIRNWLGLLRIWRIQTPHTNSLKERSGEKKKKSNKIYNPCQGLPSQECIDGGY